MEEKLDAADSFEKYTNKRKRTFQNIDEETEDCLDPRKTKKIIEFNNRESASIKSFSVKKKKKNRKYKSNFSVHVEKVIDVR